MRHAKLILLFAPLLTVTFQGLAQGDLDQLLKGSKADVAYLTSGYISPFLKTYAAGINQGWYNTAKPHKIAGFDFTASIAMVKVPTSDKSFTVNNNQLNNVYLKNSSTGGTVLNPVTGVGQIPTVFGSNEEPTFESKSTNGSAIAGTEFKGPGGIEDFDQFLGGRVPVPVLNAGIGLPKGTELKIRWTPEIDFGDGQLKMLGFGVMHDIKQHIPGIKMLPFDLSAMVAYSKMEVGVSLNDNGTQRGEFTVKGTSIQAMISKKISVITPYAGIGYGTGTSSLAVKGDYDLDGDNVAETKDPVTVEEKVAGPRFTAGLRLKLLIFTFHADYTLQKYSTFTTGFGLSIR